MNLVTYFQKIVLSIMLCLTALEMFGFEVEEFCSVSAESATFSVF